MLVSASRTRNFSTRETGRSFETSLTPRGKNAWKTPHGTQEKVAGNQARNTAHNREQQTAAHGARGGTRGPRTRKISLLAVVPTVAVAVGAVVVAAIAVAMVVSPGQCLVEERSVEIGGWRGGGSSRW